MNNLSDKLQNFLQDSDEGEEVCDRVTGKCYVKSKDGLIERTFIEKKLIVEDGRELLREDLLISNSKRQYLR